MARCGTCRQVTSQSHPPTRGPPSRQHSTRQPETSTSVLPRRPATKVLSPSQMMGSHTAGVKTGLCQGRPVSDGTHSPHTRILMEPLGKIIIAAIQMDTHRSGATQQTVASVGTIAWWQRPATKVLSVPQIRGSHTAGVKTGPCQGRPVSDGTHSSHTRILMESLGKSTEPLGKIIIAAIQMDTQRCGATQQTVASVGMLASHWRQHNLGAKWFELVLRG